MSLDNWSKVEQPPVWALKTIQAGRLKGKSDINPQWRYKAMTEVYGPCGIGWKHEIVKLWSEPAGETGEVFAFAEVNVYIKDKDIWSAPIPGIGGHKLLAKESSGLHVNDEGYKMAVTDAMSVAMKFLGVGSKVYEGRCDTKYDSSPEYNQSQPDNESQDDKPWLNESDPLFPKMKEAIKAGQRTIVDLRKKYKVSKKIEALLLA